MSIQQNKRHIPILMYHSISQSANPKFQQLTVAPALFAAQMDFLHQHAYTPLNVTQLIHALTGKSALPKRPVVITFDDGFADFYEHALPTLTRCKFTATLYISTGFVGDTSRWLQREGETERPMLSWSQIVEISNSGIECGAHTHTHPKLDTLPLPVARDEIVQSKELLEDHVGQEVSSFAYPFGFYTSAVRQLVQQIGFSSACAVNFAMSSDTTEHFTLERLMVTPNTSIEGLRMLLAETETPLLRRVYVRARIPVKHALRYGIASMERFYAEYVDGKYGTSLAR
jgi:peptidoglycan/xylan/chitin deacetylase (PgdA/CDA1 family)